MDVRTRIVLGISCRIGIDFPFSRTGNRSLFPSFSSIPCRGVMDQSEPQVLFLVPVQWPRTVGWLWVGERRGDTAKGDGPWGGKETHIGALRIGPVASRTVYLAAHITSWKRCKGANTPHLNDRSERVRVRKRPVQRRRKRTGNRAIAPRVDRTQKQHAD